MRLNELNAGKTYQFTGKAPTDPETTSRDEDFTFYVIEEGEMPIGVVHYESETTVEDRVVQLLGYVSDGGSMMTPSGLRFFAPKEAPPQSGGWTLYCAHAIDPHSERFKEPVSPLISNPVITPFQK